MLNEADARANVQSSRDAFQTLRGEKVDEKLQQVWQACRPDCMCHGEAPTHCSQGSSAELDVNCVYCLGDEQGASMREVHGTCRNTECNVCILMNTLDQPTLVALGMKRNERLSAMLQLSPFLAQQLNSGEVPEDRRKVLAEAFSYLLGCSATKLRNVANVGFLVMLCPRLVYLNLERGWGNVWSNLSKIASAIGYHQNHRSQLAALVFMRRRCIAENSSWAWFLQSIEHAEEDALAREIFGEPHQEPEATSATATATTATRTRTASRTRTSSRTTTASPTTTTTTTTTTASTTAD